MFTTSPLLVSLVLQQYLIALAVLQGRSLTDMTDGSEYGSLENRFYRSVVPPHLPPFPRLGTAAADAPMSLRRSRFGGFQRLANPVALQPHHFVSTVDAVIERHGHSAAAICDRAVDVFKEARAAVDLAVGHTYPPPAAVVASLTQLRRVADANLDAVGAVAKLDAPQAAKMAVHYDFGLCRHYPVITLASSQAPPQQQKSKQQQPKQQQPKQPQPQTQQQPQQQPQQEKQAEGEGREGGEKKKAARRKKKGGGAKRGEADGGEPASEANGVEEIAAAQ